MTTKRKPGRPRKFPAGRKNIGVRLTPKRYREVLKSAKTAGRSISEEIEHRIYELEHHRELMVHYRLMIDFSNRVAKEWRDEHVGSLDLKRLELKDGDHVVLKTDVKLSQEQANELQKSMLAHLKNCGHGTIGLTVLTGGLDLSVKEAA